MYALPQGYYDSMGNKKS